MIGANPQPTTVQHNRQQPTPQTTGLGVQRHPEGKHVGVGKFTGSFAGMKHLSRTEKKNTTSNKLLVLAFQQILIFYLQNNYTAY